ncbi:formate/nitrite transporter family protein [uncultured Salinisphaera sp.]|uniref:formate/nitrite transporter family protein n=1 Tax=uncultured Salinisphaera sp. TaxID=359372 RepID=UPI0032B23FD6
MSESSQTLATNPSGQNAKKEQNQEADLNHHERRDARRREFPSAAVVYEAIRAEAESELSRPLPGLAWSALAAGLSMGFSFIAQALLRHYSPEMAWQTIISSLGYSMGFLFVILGRQQLFTENTLTPVLEVLRVKRMETVIRTINLWLVVLATKLLVVAAAFQLVDGVQVVAAGALRGLKDTRVPMWIAIFAYWVPGFGTAVALGFFTPLGGVGVWIGLATGLAFAALLLLWRWHSRERYGLTLRSTWHAPSA